MDPRVDEVQEAPLIPRTRGPSPHFLSKSKPSHPPPKRPHRGRITTMLQKSPSPRQTQMTPNSFRNRNQKNSNLAGSFQHAVMKGVGENGDSPCATNPQRSCSIEFVEESQTIKRSTQSSIVFNIQDSVSSHPDSGSRSEISFEIKSFCESTVHVPRMLHMSQALNHHPTTTTTTATTMIKAQSEHDGRTAAVAAVGPRKSPRIKGLVSSLQTQRAQSSVTHARKATPRRDVPLKSRSELMKERPWRTNSARLLKRSASANVENRTGMRLAPSSTTLLPVKKLPPLVSLTRRSENLKKAKAEQQTEEEIESTLIDWLVITDPSSTAAKPQAAAAAEVKVEPTGTAVALGKPLTSWDLLAAETRAWVDLVHPQVALRGLLMVMRAREHAVQQSCARLDRLAQTAARLDTQLAALRDALVARRGVDLNGRPLRLVEEKGRAQRSSSTTPSALPRGVSPRLYSVPHPAPTAYQPPQRRPVSVLNAEDIPTAKRAAHAAALEAWREERKQLLQKHARLVQRSRELHFHLHRGTHIKPIAAVTAKGTGDSVALVALARLRLEANQVAAAVAKARAAHQAADRSLAQQGFFLQSALAELMLQRERWANRLDSVLETTAATVSWAKQLSQGLGQENLTPSRRSSSADGPPDAAGLLAMDTKKLEEILQATRERVRGTAVATARSLSWSRLTSEPRRGC